MQQGVKQTHGDHYLVLELDICRSENTWREVSGLNVGCEAWWAVGRGSAEGGKTGLVGLVVGALRPCNT